MIIFATAMINRRILISLSNKFAVMLTMMILSSLSLSAAPDLVSNARNIRAMFRNGYFIGPRAGIIEIGPLGSTVSDNGVEGFRLQAGVRTTPLLSSRFIYSAKIAYGFKDHKIKYGAGIDFSLHKMTGNADDYPIRQVGLKYEYNTFFPGQDIPHYNLHSFLFSRFVDTNYMVMYHRKASATFNYEFSGNLRMDMSLFHTSITPTCYFPLVNSYNHDFTHYHLSGINAELSFIPGGEFYFGRNLRHNLRPYRPKIGISLSYAPKYLDFSTFSIFSTKAWIYKRTPVMTRGYIDFAVEAAATWSHTPWPQLSLPAANYSMASLYGTFSLMRPLEFVTDNYIACFLAFSPNGSLFRKIDFLRNTTMKGIVGLNAIGGTLSSRNNPLDQLRLPRFPDHSSRLSYTKPYIEAWGGIHNIINLFNVDCFFRLTYRHLPDAQNFGVRVAIDFLM